MTSTDTAQRVLTPTTGRVLRRSLFWVGVVVFALLFALVTIGLIGGGDDGQPLSASNPAPGGAMAVAEVLRQQGVEVIEASTLTEAGEAVDDAGSTTLVLYDDGGYLDADQTREAVALADRVVILDASFSQLRAVAPEVAQAGYVGDEPIAADCSITAVDRAGEVSGGGSGFRVVDVESDTIACLGSGDDVYSLIELDGGRLTILGATEALTNELVVNHGNAAFALNLLGQEQTLVWYIPTFADIAETTDETIGELTPLWVTPVLSLLVITFIVGAVWRGRRFGPLVVENLPVTVRASETMLGRARLYERSSSRLRALDSLRVGSVQRLAKLCGLPSTATVDDVIASCASVTGAEVAGIRRLLIDDEPTTDRDLMTLSDDLLRLENDVARAVRP